MNQKPAFLNRSWAEWISSLPVFLLLVLTLVIGTGEMIHGQLLRMGERMFGDQESGIQYFMLRADPAAPSCNPNATAEAAAPASSAAMDDIDALFADEPVDMDAMHQSIEKANELCREKIGMYKKINDHLTTEVKTFRKIETTFFGIFKFGTENRSLLLLLMVAIAAVTTTLGLHHIALRPPKTRLDFRVYSVAMVLANSILVFSNLFYILQVQNKSGVEIDRPYISWIWVALFSVLALVSVKAIFSPPKDAPEGGSFGKALLSIPLFAFMGINAGISFILDGHHAGLAIYLGQMMELSGVFLNLALYIWAGMLLKQTRVVDLFLDIIRPWKLSPEMLTWVILFVAAFPTAYTGASGIFVIAAGAIIYREVQLAGARRQYALAATAMSGSLGVVLAPCLLIVVIAALNKQVTTQVLYGWGIWVFLLTSSLFFIISQMMRKQKIQIESVSVALPASARALGPVSPYIVLTLVVVYFYKFVLDTKLDEFTAPMILPVILLAIVIFDKMRRYEPRMPELPHTPNHSERRIGLEEAIRIATNDTIGHIGALILLMALSVAVGGTIERSGIMEAVPHSFGNIWLALSLLMVLLIFVGMIMDPLGAIILVTATVAPVAYNNGIHPVHFWMIVLTAFELGYLSPPVALNQLLTRQVVGEKEMEDADEEVRNESFYYRYERWILPLLVMVPALLIVVYGGAFVDWDYKGAGFFDWLPHFRLP
ncbi:MAG: TRAP transporter large permease subunit [Moraxellaceae bacterium]|nr:TRAP transporter large permease subunit [Moraxellaceae bacterium]MBP8851499.1 TRAP transporter large permease subunit [Moraxellaceae bacterium]MBP9044897.1 TRAP transporter large permease subunit [Moraxellaceae bacterium]MBP9730252.1 TRAP transporter large permease subunit [Moraxellaceae bacterium]MCC6200435.1 TRAP transporter large permease subunit [Moraxellaceae bacterium]